MKKINIFLIIWLLTAGCTSTKTTKEDEPTTIQQIPAIIKAFEAIGEVGKKKEVDKHP
jgi:uncharacterized protein YceK